MSVQHDILATISYFDIFDYPLTQTEITQFLQRSYPNHEISQALHHLSLDNWIFKFDEFYTLQDNYTLILRRRKGNQKARQMMHTADKIAAFLSGFPFVRGVALSGSLSKNFADENADIDFFIITAKNKLWLARTFMHCFKKFTFLFKKQHWFCMNYYVSESMMQIREKNIYTATEVVTLLPLRGIECFNQFYSENKWSAEYLPNHTMRVSYVKETRNSLLKKFIELSLSHPLGNALDYLLMKLTSRRWSLKTKNKKRNMRGMVMGMDSARQYAKPDPENFQKNLVAIYEKKISGLVRRYESKSKTIL
ncbi:MAG: hypothetical protein ACJ75B_03735 [Flavisolibacter sp.]